MTIPDDQIPANSDARSCTICMQERNAKKAHRGGGPTAVAGISALCVLDYVERYGLEFANKYICERHRGIQRTRDRLIDVVTSAKKEVH
jgi:hypothetical protein